MECSSIYSSFEDDKLIIPLRGRVELIENTLCEGMLKITYKTDEKILERVHRVSNSYVQIFFPGRLLTIFIRK